MSGRGAARREPFRLEGARLKVRLGLAETESLKAFAHEHSLSLSEAVRRLVRTVLKRGHLSQLEEDETDRAGLLEELVLLNLIVAEQALKVLETITPQGPGMAEEFLVAATQSVQRRLAHGPGLEPARSSGGQD